MRRAGIIALVLLSGCTKLSITDIQARFTLADAAWFEDEQTLFFFYELEAEQGISEDSLVEVTYRTDEEVFDWTATEAIEMVHPHVPVECGVNRLCGSMSLHVPKAPLSLGIRMRYHRDGEVFLNTDLVYNAIRSGPAHTNRSFTVYGVFAGDNRRIQWRGRHRFPTLRNMQVQELGLRRFFRVEDQRYGTASIASDDNPYGYATGCPAGLSATTLGAVETEARAIFNPDPLPIEATAESVVCAQSTVHEPVGPFVSSAIARKNPEVEPAFPVLRTPVKEATAIQFYLAPCERTIDADADEMQRQRILYEGDSTYCIDDWARPDFVDRLVVDLRDAIEAERPGGRDMILVIGLHRDDPGVADKVQEALELVLPAERDRSTPRTAGAFVFDSDIRTIEGPLAGLVLWCPATVVIDDDIDPTMLPTASQISCGILPTNESISLGPFTLSALPILPSHSRYLGFIDQFSKGQAGSVTKLTYLVPEFTTTTDNVDIGLGVGTFFNDERITAEPDHAFSYCAQADSALFGFRSTGTRLAQCPPGETGEGFDCLPGGVAPIEFLPDWHVLAGETDYELGLGWLFPWLLTMDYRVVGAASANAFGLSLPFGFGADQVSQLGTEQWLASEFSMEQLLTQCKRFCDHPTFDSAGVYNVTRSFRDAYRTQCYVPRFPMPNELVQGDSSFPLDP